MHLNRTTFSVELPVAAEPVLRCALGGNEVECLGVDHINNSVVPLRPWSRYDCDEVPAIGSNHDLWFDTEVACRWRRAVPGTARYSRVVGSFLVGTYNARVHREIRVAPQADWSGNGWLPRTPNRLEDLDLLLISAAKARTVHRDGMHFQGMRYMDPTWAAYVKETVTICYDPRDVAEILVFHRNRFLCHAVSLEHSSQAITLKISRLHAPRTDVRFADKSGSA